MFGLSVALESAAVQCSIQKDMVLQMRKELQETRKFVEVRLLSRPCSQSDSLYIAFS